MHGRDGRGRSTNPDYTASHASKGCRQGALSMADRKTLPHVTLLPNKCDWPHNTQQSDLLPLGKGGLKLISH